MKLRSYISRGWCFTWLVALGLVVAIPHIARAQFQKQYKLVTISDDVFAIVWEDITQFPVEGNHLVIMNDEDVVVVDANRTPSLADTVIAIIRRHTSKPVRYVINTHWHADHVQGNAVYQREFPNVDIIGHPKTTAGIDTVLLPYVEEVQSDVEAARQELSAASDSLTEDQHEQLKARLMNLEREEQLYANVEFRRPTLLVTDSITIRRGSRKIKVLHLGPANTPGDLVVYLPEERILATGDLVTKPFPFLGWDSPGSWYRALDNLLARNPHVAVPGHGDVMQSMEYVELFRDLFQALSQQVADGIAEGQTLEELQESVELNRFWREFAGEDERLFQAFASRFQPAAVERAYRELRP